MQQIPLPDLPRAPVCGAAAIDGLSELITDAVRKSDDALVGSLDRILCDVEQLIALANAARLDRQGAAYSVHEPQAGYDVERTSAPPPSFPPA